MKNKYFCFEQRVDTNSGQNNSQSGTREKATITQKVRAVIVVQEMEEKAHDAELQNGQFGAGNNNLNLHPFKLDSSQDIKNDKYMSRNKMLFKPVNHFEVLLAKKKKILFPSPPLY